MTLSELDLSWEKRLEWIESGQYRRVNPDDPLVIVLKEEDDTIKMEQPLRLSENAHTLVFREGEGYKPWDGLKGKKKADYTILERLESGQWRLQLIELKKTVKDAGKWNEVRAQLANALQKSTVLLGILGVQPEDVEVHCYCVFENGPDTETASQKYGFSDGPESHTGRKKHRPECFGDWDQKEAHLKWPNGSVSRLPFTPVQLDPQVEMRL